MKKALRNPTLVYATAVLFGLMIGIAACTGENKSNQEPESNTKAMRANHAFASSIEKAHSISGWNKKEVIKTDIKLRLGSNALDATLFVETGGPEILIEISEDTLAIFDGQEMYAMPSDSAVNPFTLKTWAYFLEAPYKLNDPGTIMEDRTAAQMKGQTYDRAKLTFKSGTGDTPDDWYILYRDQNNNRLQAMAYIVTAGKSVEDAAKDPHAISYEDFQTVEGVPVATTWKFWGWSEENEFSDEPIGTATLTNIKFLQSGSLFSPPDGAKQMKR